MIYGKLDRYLLIAAVIILVGCACLLFMSFRKDQDRDNLLVAMAKKLGASGPDEEGQSETKVASKKEAPKPTEEEEGYITHIADKLCFSKPLDANEKEFQQRFGKEINDELINSRKVLGILINKFSTGVKEFDDFEKEFYEANKEEIDHIINNKRMMDSIVQKLIDGKTDFSPEELQFQQTYGQYIEIELQKRKQPPSEPLKGANPPMAADERLKVILGLFTDNIPKTVTEITEQYAKITSTAAHKGNRSIDLGKLVDDGKLKCEKIGKKVYHGPPEWFQGKNLKTQYRPSES